MTDLVATLRDALGDALGATLVAVRCDQSGIVRFDLRVGEGGSVRLELAPHAAGREHLVDLDLGQLSYQSLQGDADGPALARAFAAHVDRWREPLLERLPHLAPAPAATPTARVVELTPAGFDALLDAHDRALLEARTGFALRAATALPGTAGLRLAFASLDGARSVVLRAARHAQSVECFARCGELAIAYVEQHPIVRERPDLAAAALCSLLVARLRAGGPVALRVAAPLGATAGGRDVARWIGRETVPGWRVDALEATSRGELACVVTRGEAFVRFFLGAPVAGAPAPLFRGASGDRFGAVTRDVAEGVARESAEALLAAREGIASLLPHLAIEPHGGASPRDDVATMPLTPAAVAARLAPAVTLDGPPWNGYVLRGIALAAPLEADALALDALTLDWEPQRGGSRLRLAVGHARALPHPFGRVGELAVALRGESARPEGEALPWAEARLGSALLARFAATAPSGLRVRVVDALDDIADVALPRRPRAAPRDASARLELHLASECGQRCTFCGVRPYADPVDNGRAQLDAHRARLRLARAEGLQRVAINGFDPATFSHFLDLVAAARAEGFTHLDVMGTARPFADPVFRRRFFELGPAEGAVFVPLYGATAAVHDAVTGAPGSFVEASAALDGLLADGGTARVRVWTVITPRNVAEAVALTELVEARGLRLAVKLAYPTPGDGALAEYDASALTESAVVRRMLDDARDADARALVTTVLQSCVVHPCVLASAGVAPAPRGDRRRPALPGVDGSPASLPMLGRARATIATVPCPHAQRCSLADACPASHYARYATLFGLDEFAPPD